MDRWSYRPLRTGLAILKTLRRLWPSEFAWREPPYEYETERLAIDILAGGGQVRDQIESGLPLDDLEATWHGELEHFKRIREGYLLYK
jgi:uncharacterized protein YbbC (DUF1343 family)